MSALSAQDFKAIRGWMRDCGIGNPEDYRDSFLERRVHPRMQASGFADATAFLSAHGTQAKSRKALLQKFFIPTTEFMRNPEVLEEACRLLAARAGRRRGPLRVLSAACSTGEEPYSMTLLLTEAGADFEILALDRSLQALRAVRSGVFQPRTLAKVDKALRERYFIETAAGLRATASLVSKVAAACWDLGWGFPPGPFDAILLRNILIYFTEEAKGRLVGQAARALRPGGLLILGRAESLGRTGGGVFRALDRDRRIYEKAHA